MSTCIVVGPVVSSTPGTNQNGKPMVRVIIEERRQNGEKTYKKRFCVDVYGYNADTARTLNPGDIVKAVGDVGAYVSESKDGKQYANLTLSMANIERI